MGWMEFAKISVTFIGGGLAGAMFTQLCNHYRGRLQKMRCSYMEDEIQSMVPVPVDGHTYNNLHLKRFQIVNTTNIDIKEFGVRFVFDLQANIIDYSSRSKAGESKTNITKAKGKNNECVMKVEYFNRGDKVEVSLRIADICENAYYVTETNSTGFKLIVKDKRKKGEITNSRFSQTLG